MMMMMMMCRVGVGVGVDVDVVGGRWTNETPSCRQYRSYRSRMYISLLPIEPQFNISNCTSLALTRAVSARVSLEEYSRSETA